MTITDSVTDLAAVAARQVRRPDLRDLLGTPFLELETAVVAERLRAISRTFPGAAIHYAVNANPHPDVLATVVAAGANFAVASPAEVRAGLAAGAAPDDLIYTKPVTRRDDIAQAAAMGVRLFVVDTMSAVQKVAETAPGTAVVCRLLTSGKASGWPLTRRNGCSVSQAVDVLRLAADLGLDPAGISFHVGSNERDPDAWRLPIVGAATVFETLGHQGITPWLLDLGGGFSADHEGHAAPLAAYGAVIEDQLSRSFGHHRPRTIVEPGRAVIGSAGALVTTVVGVIRRGDTRWVYLDAGAAVALVDAEDAYGRHIETSADGGPTGLCILAGSRLEIARRRSPVIPVELPLSLAEGDVVRLELAGAYPSRSTGSDPLAVVIG